MDYLDFYKAHNITFKESKEDIKEQVKEPRQGFEFEKVQLLKAKQLSYSHSSGNKKVTRENKNFNLYGY